MRLLIRLGGQGLVVLVGLAILTAITVVAGVLSVILNPLVWLACLLGGCR